MIDNNNDIITNSRNFELAHFIAKKKLLVYICCDSIKFLKCPERIGIFRMFKSPF